jgi:flagellar biosynthesis/type III secretory pathway chaperone
VESRETVSVILEELEKVLTDEHRALRVLDHDAIEHASAQKLSLDARLRAADASKTAADLPKLKRVRRMALDNQLLIVHARACLQGIITMVTGDSPATYGATAQRRAPISPLRLNVRV